MTRLTKNINIIEYAVRFYCDHSIETSFLKKLTKNGHKNKKKYTITTQKSPDRFKKPTTTKTALSSIIKKEFPSLSAQWKNDRNDGQTNRHEVKSIKLCRKFLQYDKKSSALIAWFYCIDWKQAMSTSDPGKINSSMQLRNCLRHCMSCLNIVSIWCTWDLNHHKLTLTLIVVLLNVDATFTARLTV